MPRLKLFYDLVLCNDHSAALLFIYGLLVDIDSILQFNSFESCWVHD